MIPPNIHESWIPYIGYLFEDERMIKIRDILLQDDSTYLPERSKIFRVFEMPINEIKVVILGQDPYSKPGQATGLAFAVTEKTSEPPSLRIIQSEVINTQYGKQSKTTGKEWKTLEHWEEQGVFLLNTALTVKVGRPDSHTQYWVWFIWKILEIISKEINPIWLLWGAKAREFKNVILTHNQSARILTAPHPAAEARNPGIGFIGCDHFKKVNEMLAVYYASPINF